MFGNHQTLIWLLFVTTFYGSHANDGSKMNCDTDKYMYFDKAASECRSCSRPCGISVALCKHFGCGDYLNRHKTTTPTTSTNVELTDLTASAVTVTATSHSPSSPSLNKNSESTDVTLAIVLPIIGCIISISIIIVIIIKKRSVKDLCTEKKTRHPKKGVDNSDAGIPLIDELSLEDVVNGLKSSVDMNAEPNIINVVRGKVLEGAFRAINRKGFDPKKHICVEFIDFYGVSEDEDDAGSFRREFFNLVLKEISESEMFVGPDSCKILVPSQTALKKDLYAIAGQLIALSIAHRCRGPQFFSPVLYDVITASTGSDIDELYRAAEQARSFLQPAGNSTPSVIRSLDDDTVGRAAVRKQIDDRTREAIDRFTAGLSTLNVLEKIKQHPKLFKPIFCGKPPELTAATIKILFPPKMSVPGSNAYQKEINALAYWRDYLQDVQVGEAKTRLEDILRFATGSEVIPPCGFDETPRLEFLDGSLPMSNTCACVMRIPKDHVSYESFKNAMDLGVLCSPYFGLGVCQTKYRITI